MIRLLGRFWILLPIIVSCGPHYGPRPDLPDSASVCENACKVLEHFRCKEGLDPECNSKCERVHSLGYIWVDDTSGPQCVVEYGKTLQSVRDCNVKCEVL